MSQLSELDSNSQWLQLQADDFTAWVSRQTLQRHPESLLCGLADTAVAQGRDRLRLDMSPDVAREMVAALRLGDGYVPPEDARLLAALQHQLDYLGLPAPCRLPTLLPPTQPYLFVHSYSCASVEEHGQDIGMLLYSAQGGWSTLDKDAGDPRPPGMDPEYYYAATTLPAAATGCGYDLMLVAGPEKSNSFLMEADTRTVHAVPSCKGPPGPCVAVGSRAFLLGQHGSATVSCFDPLVACWFTATSMPAGGSYDFAAVSPPGSSIVLTLGGVDSATGRHRADVDLYDSRVRRWMPSPSGVRLPKASRGLAAAPLDAHRVLVWGGSGGPAAHILELRTWKLQPAGHISSQRQHMAGVAFGPNVVLSLGGVDEHDENVDVMEAYDDATQSWSVIGRLPCPMSHMAATAASVSTGGISHRMGGGGGSSWRGGGRRSSGQGGGGGGGGTPTGSMSG